jgi:hypothetical protein
MTKRQLKSTKLAEANRRHGFQPGQSGNPAGRPADQEYREAVAMLKAKSPALMTKAIQMAMDGSEKVLVALIHKICPETLKLQNDTPLLVVIQKAIQVHTGESD